VLKPLKTADHEAADREYAAFKESQRIAEIMTRVAYKIYGR